MSHHHHGHHHHHHRLDVVSACPSGHAALETHSDVVCLVCVCCSRWAHRVDYVVIALFGIGC